MCVSLHKSFSSSLFSFSFWHEGVLHCTVFGGHLCLVARTNSSETLGNSIYSSGGTPKATSVGLVVTTATPVGLTFVFVFVFVVVGKQR